MHQKEQPRHLAWPSRPSRSRVRSGRSRFGLVVGARPRSTSSLKEGGESWAAAQDRSRGRARFGLGSWGPRGRAPTMGSRRRGRLVRRHWNPRTSESCASLLGSIIANQADGVLRLAINAPPACDPSSAPGPAPLQPEGGRGALSAEAKAPFPERRGPTGTFATVGRGPHAIPARTAWRPPEVREKPRGFGRSSPWFARQGTVRPRKLWARSRGSRRRGALSAEAKAPLSERRGPNRTLAIVGKGPHAIPARTAWRPPEVREKPRCFGRSSASTARQPSRGHKRARGPPPTQHEEIASLQPEPSGRSR